MTIRTKLNGSRESLVGLNADASLVEAGYVTLVADTDKTINIPEGALGVHIYHNLASSVFFRVGAAVTLPTGEIRQTCGFVAPGNDASRILTTQPFGAGNVLHLRCADAGDILVEFWG